MFLRRAPLTIALVLVALLAGAGRAAAEPGYVASGHYTGDGVNGRAITGLGFQPAVVIVKGDRADGAVCRTADMPVGSCKHLTGTWALQSNRLLSLDADGFTVGSDTDVNASGSSYTWVAFSAGDAIRVGSYAGIGLLSQTISGLGIDPTLVVVMGEGATRVWHRSGQMTAGYSLPFSTEFASTGRITNLVADGFQVGTSGDVNALFGQYHYIAWADRPGELATGRYWGDGVDGSAVELGGFQPDYVLVKSGGSTAGAHRPAALAGDATLHFEALSNFANGIQTLTAAGIERGSSAAVNQSGQPFYWLAARGADHAELSLALSADDLHPAEGQALLLTLVLANAGPRTATGVELSLPEPPGLVFDAVTIEGVDGDPGPGPWALPALPAGMTATVEISARVESDTAGGSIAVTAAITAAALPDLHPADDSAMLLLQLPGADLALGLSATPAAVAEGDSVLLELSLANGGPDPAADIVVKTWLPSALVYLSDQPSQGSFSSSSGNWQLASLAAGGNATLRILVRAAVGSEGELLQVASVVTAATPTDPTPADAADAVDVAVTSFEVFTLTALGDTWIDQEDPATNHGDEEDTRVFHRPGEDKRALFGFDLSSIPSASRVRSAQLELTVRSADDSGLPVRIHRVTAPWNEETVTWGNHGDAVDPDIVADFLPTLPHRYAIEIGGLVGDWVTGALANQGLALIASSTNRESRYYTKEDGNPARHPLLIVQTTGLADLAVSLAVDDDAPDVGQRLRFTASVLNEGPRVADAVALRAVLPAGLEFVAAAPGAGSYHAGSGLWTLGALESGASATLLLDVDVPASSAGLTLVDSLSVATCAQGDPDPADNAAAVSVQVQAADLALALSVDQANPPPGALLNYQLRVDNLGPTAATSLVLRDSLAAGLSLQGATASQGSFESGTGLWQVGALAAGDSATLALSVQMLADGDLEHLAWRVGADQGDPVAANDTTRLTVLPAAADLALAMSVDNPTAGEGEALAFTLSVENLGPQATESIQIADLLPAGLLYQGDTPSQGSYAPGSGLWSLGALAPGASATLVLSATPAPGTAGTAIENSAARLSSTPTDPEPANDSAALWIAVGGTDLALTLGVDADEADPGELRLFTLAVKNLGPRAASGISIRDSLAAGLVLETGEPAQGSYDAQTGLWSLGALAAGDSVQLLLSARVQSGWAGQRLGAHASIAALDQIDPTPDDDADSTAVYVRAADLTFSLAVADTLLEVGDPCAVVATLVNGGPQRAEAVVVVLELPPGLSLTSYGAGQGAFSPATGIWSLGNLESGSAAALSLALEAAPEGAGQTLLLSGQAGAQTEDPAPADNAAAQSIAVGGVYLPTLALSAPPQASQTLYPGGGQVAVFELRLVNGCPEMQTLESLTLHNATTGAGSAAQLDADWTALSLSAQLAAAGSEIVEAEALRATASMAGGTARFSNLDIAMAAGDTLTLRVRGGASLTARDGDRLDLQLSGPADLALAEPCSLSAAWPLAPAGDFPVDGMAAAQVLLTPPGSATLMTGTENALVMDLRVPANGYSADLLQKVNVVNGGSAQAGTDIAALRLWRDDGDGLFDPALDVPLGELLSTVARWERYGLSEAVPVGGLRLFVSADIAALATEGATVALGLPVDPTDTALGMASTNDGPVDRSVSAAQTQVISANDRITVSAPPLAELSAAPGAQDLPLLALQFSNSFAVAKTLVRLDLAAAGSGSGTPAELAEGLERVALWEDADGDGQPDGGEPLATAGLSGGSASLAGFAWTLAAESQGRLLVTADLSLDRAADGDRLGARIEGAEALGFTDATAAAALYPLGGEGVLLVDGMVVAQLANHGAPTATVGPGEGPVLALDFHLPANGYAADDLLHLTVRDMDGSAGGDELGNLELWADGGDGLWGAGGGDDLDLGALAWLGSSWQSAFSAIPVPESGLRLYVSFTVSPALADSATLRLGVPVDGIVMASGNDGPRDQALINPELQLLSTATLLSSLSIAPAGSIVGQTVTVAMTLRNLSAERMTGVAPSPLTATGTGSLALQSGPTPTDLALDPGESGLISWSYLAQAAGQVALRGSATGLGDESSLTHLSLATSSSLHQIWVEADSLALHAAVSLPFVVNRGQTDVLPLHLTFSHAGGAQASDVELESLQLRLRAPDGSGIAPAALLAGLRVKEGAQVYLSRDAAAMETAGDQLNLALTQAVRIQPGEPVTLDLAVDIAAGTLVPEFSLLIESALAFGAVDATSGAPVAVALDAGSFPITAGPARVSAPAESLLVSSAADSLRPAGQGQPGVLLETLRLENPGLIGITADLRLLGFALAGTDSAGTAPLALGARLARLRVVDESGGLHAELILSPDETGPLALTCAPLVGIAAGTPRQLHLIGDLAPGAPLGVFRLRLEPPASLQVHDAISGAPVPAAYAEPLLLGHAVRVEAAADRLYAHALAVAPDSASVGARNLPVLAARLRHPGGAGEAGLRMAGCSLRFLDALRDSLVPGLYAERLRATWNGAPLAELTSLPAAGGSVYLPLGDRLLAPGETAELAIELDIEASAPAGFIELALDGPGCLAFDVNTGESALLAAEPGEALPLLSGLIWLEEAPRDFVLGLANRLPAVLAADGQEVPCALLTLANPAAPGAGAVGLAGFRFAAEDRGGAPLALGAAASRLRLYRGDQLWAESAALSADSTSAWIGPGVPAAIEPGPPLALELRAVLSEDFTGESLRFTLAEVDVALMQPANPLLAVTVRPAPGQAFPLMTGVGGFSPRSLAASYSNFPNPFPAGRGETTLAYYLERPARVSLKLWTGRGELVSTLLDEVLRPAGLQQEDRWDGSNERGTLVQNGVYLAELRVHYEGGGEERLLRKVAVLR